MAYFRRGLLQALMLVLALAMGSHFWRHAHTPHLAYHAPPPPAVEQDNRPDPALTLTARVDAARHAVLLKWNAADPSLLYRSTRNLTGTRLNLVRYPITAIRIAGNTTHYDDAEAADGTRYFYQVRLTDATGRSRYSAVVPVTTAPRALPARIAAPLIRIDKHAYTLAVCAGGTVLKRYPVALGRNPVRRKLNEDNASTPEGRYHVTALQPHAAYYRAYDLDYPNPEDRARYQEAAQRGLLPVQDDGGRPAIGGEIEIHGRGIQRNWTYGCIALRNADMDELFRHPEIAVGVPVHIWGGELGRTQVEPGP